MEQTISLPGNNSKVLESFDVIFRNFLEHGICASAQTEEYKYLHDKYRLDAECIDALAILVNCYPRTVCREDLPFCPKAFETLLDGRYIICSNQSDNDSMQEEYTISEEAYGAFLRDDNFEYLFEDCMKRLKSCPESVFWSSPWIQRFVNSLSLPTNKPLKEAADKLGVSELEAKTQQTFWKLAVFFAQHFTTGFPIDDLDGEDIAKLDKLGLITYTIPDYEDNDNTALLLSPKAVNAIFYGCEEIIRYDDLNKFAVVIRCADIKKKELFFSEAANQDIDNLRKMLSQKGFARAMSILEKSIRPMSIQSLFWGPSGTGKTEIIKQLALETGRDIILFDVARVIGSHWGVAEKSYRSLFLSYKYVAAISRNVPILLLNEADDILSKRSTSMDQSMSKTYNTLTNILLQELESLNGIVLATTNLIDNIDKAFYRRFLFTTRLIKPDASAREKIWKSRIPRLSEIDAHVLAVSFELSGAQIDNVVTKYSLAELYYEGDRDFEFIAKLCSKELASEQGSKTYRKSIGY